MCSYWMFDKINTNTSDVFGYDCCQPLITESYYLSCAAFSNIGPGHSLQITPVHLAERLNKYRGYPRIVVYK